MYKNSNVDVLNERERVRDLLMELGGLLDEKAEFERYLVKGEFIEKYPREVLVDEIIDFTQKISEFTKWMRRAKLSAKTQELLRLKFVEGKEMKELQKTFGISRSGINKNISRALDNLAKTNPPPSID